MRFFRIALLLLCCRFLIFSGNGNLPAVFSICDGTVINKSKSYYVSNVIIEVGGNEHNILNPERAAVVTLPDSLVQVARDGGLFTLRVWMTSVKKEEKKRYGILSYIKKGELCLYPIPALKL